MIQQSYSREFAESPRFTYNNPQLLNGASDVISWETEDTRSKKYLPFNFTRIVNNGEGDIKFYPNQDEENEIYIPAGTIISIDRTSLPAVSSFKIVNNSGVTITANKIVISNSREGQNSDSVVQRLHKRLLGRESSRLV